MQPFEIPESVKAYFQEPATRAVVDSLVSTLGDPVLPDMDRNKLINLSEGVLLACQIRADFVGFMVSLWGNTFGEALVGSGLKEIFPEDCTIKEVWTERYFWSYVIKGDDNEQSQFELTVQIDQRSHEVKLCVFHYDEGDELVEFGPRLRIPEGWERKNYEGPNRMLEPNAGIPIKDLISNPNEGIAKLKESAIAIVRFICRILQ